MRVTVILALLLWFYGPISVHAQDLVKQVGSFRVELLPPDDSVPARVVATSADANGALVISCPIGVDREAGQTVAKGPWSVQVVTNARIMRGADVVRTRFGYTPNRGAIELQWTVWPVTTSPSGQEAQLHLSDLFLMDAGVEQQVTFLIESSAGAFMLRFGLNNLGGLLRDLPCVLDPDS